MGVLPAQGTVSIDGKPAPASVEGRIAAGVRLVPENRELFSTMTVADNLLVVDVADEAYVMELGESKLSGTVVAVAANPDVVTSYLGFASA